MSKNVHADVDNDMQMHDAQRKCACTCYAHTHAHALAQIRDTTPADESPLPGVLFPFPHGVLVGVGRPTNTILAKEVKGTNWAGMPFDKIRHTRSGSSTG